MSDTAGVVRRRAVVVGIALAVAAAHVMGLGRFLPEPRLLYCGYFLDLAIPFTFYFLPTWSSFAGPRRSPTSRRN